MSFLLSEIAPNWTEPALLALLVPSVAATALYALLLAFHLIVPARLRPVYTPRRKRR